GGLLQLEMDRRHGPQGGSVLRIEIEHVSKRHERLALVAAAVVGFRKSYPRRQELGIALNRGLKGDQSRVELAEPVTGHAKEEEDLTIGRGLVGLFEKAGSLGVVTRVEGPLALLHRLSRSHGREKHAG